MNIKNITIMYNYNISHVLTNVLNRKVCQNVHQIRPPKKSNFIFSDFSMLSRKVISPQKSKKHLCCNLFWVFQKKSLVCLDKASKLLTDHLITG